MPHAMLSRLPSDAAADAVPARLALCAAAVVVDPSLRQDPAAAALRDQPPVGHSQRYLDGVWRAKLAARGKTAQR